MRAGSPGYRGRTGIYELVTIDDELRTMIHDGAGEQQLERYARTRSPSIRDDGLRKAWPASPPSKKCCASPARTEREKQLLPLEVSEIARQEASRQKSFSLRRGMSAADLAMVTRQLATLVHSSLPLEEALLAVSEQTESPRVKSILIGVRSRVMEGHTLADGFGDFPQAFPEIYRATVAAGEQSGHLDAVLERLADYTESRQVLRQKVQHAMIYPVVLSVLALLIVSGMLVYVVPKVVGVFSNTGRDLPGLTVMLIALSDFLRDYGIFLLVALIAAAGYRHSTCLAPARPQAALRQAAVAPAAGRQAGPRLEHRAFHPHAQHPEWQRCAGARRPAHLRRSDHQHTDA
jgi:hypothetical protein